MNKNEQEKFHIYMTKFYKDKTINTVPDLPEWLQPIQAGAALTKIRVADITDNTGENISTKNPNYSELTALYWIWKNCLANINERDYYGLFHYRRWLDVNNEDFHNIIENDIDAILPLPTIHEPDIFEHHCRYIKGTDWDATIQALKELQPAYYDSYEAIFSQEYMFNYNIIVAKAKILKDYCEWLFPLLERVEELSGTKDINRKDRYIGYIGENLLTLYFLHHRNDINYVCTGRIFFN